MYLHSTLDYKFNGQVGIFLKNCLTNKFISLAFVSGTRCLYPDLRTLIQKLLCYTVNI
jgi:hypothetical protein